MFTRIRILALGALAGAALAAAPAAAQSGDEPLARFEDPVCVGVAGLQTEAAADMVGRMRANAESFGRRLAPDGACEPNVIVAFIGDPDAFLQRLQQQSGWLFAEMRQEESAALLRETGPARALLRVRAHSRDGLPIARRENMTEIPQTEMWSAHSKIYSATRNDIQSAMILFDRDEISGLTIDQLADYATLRALTRTLPETAEARADSVLALFDADGNRPEGLTEFDRVYLSTLYKGIPNLPASARLAQLEAATGRDIFMQ